MASDNMRRHSLLSAAVLGLLSSSMPVVSSTATMPVNEPHDVGRRKEKDARRFEKANAKRAMRAAKRTKGILK